MQMHVFFNPSLRFKKSSMEDVANKERLFIFFGPLTRFNPSLRLRRLHEGWEEGDTRKIFF